MLGKLVLVSVLWRDYFRYKKYNTKEANEDVKATIKKVLRGEMLDPVEFECVYDTITMNDYIFSTKYLVRQANKFVK
jgi:hypothetical protein